MRDILPRFSTVRALIVGDCMLDRYIEGNVTRISPEAPAPIVSVVGEHVCLGGAANVAAGTAALGCRTDLAGVIGADSAGEAVRELAAQLGVNTEQLMAAAAASTICKTRILADRKQQLLRLDRDGDAAARTRAAKSLSETLSRGESDHNVIVLADYEKGTLFPELIRLVIERCATARIPVIVDPKKEDFSVYAGATVITPNLAELERASRRKLFNHEEIVAAARALRLRYTFGAVVCTCGADGMVLVSEDRATRIPAHVREVADVAGAGDTVVATLAACLGGGASIDDACRVASLAAGLAVAQPSVYVVRLDELERANRRHSCKIVSPAKASALAQGVRDKGRKIVFTNGCFDVLHAGHLAYLEEAKLLGDELIVGLNSDESIARLKGHSRPRMALEHRAALLAGLTCVDWVLPFTEDTPEALLQILRPDVLVKGGDYSPDEIRGAEFVRSYGGEVCVTKFIEGLSTTKILERF